MNKIKLGIITPIYITQERNDISLAWTYSMMQAFNHIPEDMEIRHIIVDDCSPKVSLLIDYNVAAKQFKNVVVKWLQFSCRLGKWFLGYKFQTGIQSLIRDYGCNYIISIPDDVLINPWLFYAIKESIKHIDNNIKAITYFKDIRRGIWGKDEIDGRKYNEYFNYASCCDGFMLLAEADIYKSMIKNIDPKEAESKGSTMVWREANNYLSKYKIIEYKESLAQHIGNSFSSMVGAPRNKDRYIYANTVNLFNKPEIVK